MLDASGAAGGGELLLGGGYQGQDARLSNAQTTTLEAGAQLRADATTQGDGGTVIVWADDTTRVHGSVSARGGPQGGDGGFIETSGKRLLEVTQAADASAPRGKGGAWLLDPMSLSINNVTIDSDGLGTLIGVDPQTFTAPMSNSFISASTISTALNQGTSVTINTSTGGSGNGVGDITVASPITKSGGGEATLTLTAHNDINLNANISSTSSKLNLVMNADSDNSGYGSTVLGTATVSLNGGNLTAISNNARVRLPNADSFTLNNATATVANLSLDGGTFNLSSGTLVVSGALTNTGTIDLASNATFRKTGGFINNGTLQGSGTIDVRAGNTLTNNGTLSPGGSGTAGRLSITGDLVMGSSSTLAIDVLGAAVAGTDYDQLAVSGTATLGGTLSLTERTGFKTQFSQSLTPLTYGSKSGTFSTVSTTANSDNAGFGASLGDTSTAVALAYGTTNYVTSGTSNWGVDGNWDRGLPTALADAVIGVGGSDTVAVTGAAAAKSLTVSGNTTLSVGYGGALTVAGNASIANLTMTDGALSVNGSLSVSNSYAQSGGAVTAASLSATQVSGDLNLSGGSITTTGALSLTAQAGSVLQSGGAVQAAGNVTVRAGNDLTVAGAVHTDGTLASGPGGSITLEAVAGALTISESGSVTSTGGNGYVDMYSGSQAGYAGGAISLTAGDAIKVLGSVSSLGGTGYSPVYYDATGPSQGGPGGAITFNAASIAIGGSVQSMGGDGGNAPTGSIYSGADGGYGGLIHLTATGHITLNASASILSQGGYGGGIQSYEGGYGRFVGYGGYGGYGAGVGGRGGDGGHIQLTAGANGSISLASSASLVSIGGNGGRGGDGGAGGQGLDALTVSSPRVAIWEAAGRADGAVPVARVVAGVRAGRSP